MFKLVRSSPRRTSTIPITLPQRVLTMPAFASAITLLAGLIDQQPQDWRDIQVHIRRLADGIDRATIPMVHAEVPETDALRRARHQQQLAALRGKPAKRHASAIKQQHR